MWLGITVNYKLVSWSHDIYYWHLLLTLDWPWPFKNRLLLVIAWITFMKLYVIIPLLLKPCLAVLAIRLKITRSTHGPVLHNLWTHCRMEGDRNLIWSEIVKMYGPQWSRAGGSGNTVETLSVRRRKSITERVTWGGGWRRVDVDREPNKGGGLVRETLFHWEVKLSETK